MRKQPELDYEQLQKQLTPKEQSQELTNKVAIEAVRNRLHKVAFDVYVVDNDPYDGLWRLEANADDGKEYLVRLEDDNVENIKTASVWTATSNESGTSITLSYKGMPIQRMSNKIFGFSKDDVGLFKRALLEKVESNNSFRGKIIDMQPEEKKAELLKEFPELFVK